MRGGACTQASSQMSGKVFILSLWQQTLSQVSVALVQHSPYSDDKSQDKLMYVSPRGAPSGQKIVAGTDLLHTRISDETKVVSKNCILGFLMKPKWFQMRCKICSSKLHSFFFLFQFCVKPVWFHTKSEYAIFPSDTASCVK